MPERMWPWWFVRLEWRKVYSEVVQLLELWTAVVKKEPTFEQFKSAKCHLPHTWKV